MLIYIIYWTFWTGPNIMLMISDFNSLNIFFNFLVYLYSVDLMSQSIDI